MSDKMIPSKIVVYTEACDFHPVVLNGENRVQKSDSITAVLLNFYFMGVKLGFSANEQVKWY